MADVVTIQFYIPTADNAGVAFDAPHHDLFAAAVLARFSGLSILPGEVAGRWIDGGTLYADSMKVYCIDVEGVLARSADLTHLIDFAKAHYGQLKVMVRYLNVAEIL